MYNNRNAKDEMEIEEHPYRLINKLIVEFIGDLIFIFIGISQGIGDANLTKAALAHGFTIFLLISSLGHISGGHFNPAVSFAIALCGKLKPLYAILYIIAQLLGGFCGALLARAIMTQTEYSLMNGGSTLVSEFFPWYQGLIVEIVLTYILVETVLLTAVDTSSNFLAPFAIGSSVMVDILAGGAITGASMNPARSVGPAIAAVIFGVKLPSSYIMKYQFIYIVGPLLGGATAAVLYRTVLRRDSERILQ